MIASCHMMVNPMQRWQEYGAESSQNLEIAMEQDPNNPRPYF
jgi:pentose-5-phosphate-3-epimerase